MLARVPESVADVVASPAGCATATAAAALERAGSLSKRRVVVIGGGMLGLAAVAMLGEAGAGPVTVVDPDPERRALALAYGADAALDQSADLPTCDVAFDFSGSVDSIERVFATLDVAGVLVLVGSVAPSAPLGLDPERVVRRWLTVAGVHNYEPRHLQRAVDFLGSASHLPWHALVAPPRPLEELRLLMLDPRPTHPRLAVTP
jgi:threonine dehydrogenase-like Zn-dependent dehydrogenase